MSQRIVDLEHESGLRPVGDFPDHCARCRAAAERRGAQEACSHKGDVVEVRAWGVGIIARSCADCGAAR